MEEQKSDSFATSDDYGEKGKRDFIVVMVDFVSFPF
jgi:hypothetical protein